MSIWHKYNNENILMRAVIAGLLDVLNNQIKYNQVWSDEEIEEIKVPWFFNQSGDERFMQDFYTMYAQCVPPKPVDGNFDFIPRGIVSYTGSAIDSGRITTRYVQGTYVKEIDNKLEQFVSFLYSIPLNVSFDLELWIDTYTTALKIEQQLREVFYKNKTYYVYYKGLRVGCTAGFPEQVGIEKKIEYSFEENNKIKLRFSLEVEAYQPVFDPTTEMKASNRMSGFAYRLYSGGEKSDGEIEITSPKGNGLIIPKGTPLWIDWNYRKEGAIINKVNAYWLNFNENTRFDIELNIPNHEYYIWNIPEDFTQFKSPAIIWEEDSSVNIISNPLVNVIPDLNSKQITSESFYVSDAGYFYTNDVYDTSIAVQLEMKDDGGNVSYTPDNAIFINILYNKINEQNPAWVNPDVSIYYPGSIDYKHINIQIANTVNTDVFGIASDIKIV